MPRKAIVDLIGELRSWLPNYDHGPKDYPTVLYRILASAPGGEELEDIGYEPFSLGWHELDQLGRVLVAIQDKRDVEDLIAGLIHDEEEEQVEEAGLRNPMVRARPAAGLQMPPPALEARRPKVPAGMRRSNKSTGPRHVPARRR